MNKKKLITFLLALTMILSLSVGASAAETTEAKVPVTLTVVNTISPISCTVPAALPVSLVDLSLIHISEQTRQEEISYAII